MLTPYSRLRSRCAGRQSVRSEGERAQANSRCRENRVSNGRREAEDRRLAGARGGQILPVDKDDVDLRRVGEARDAILGEVRIQDPALLELDGLEERSS